MVDVKTKPKIKTGPKWTVEPEDDGSVFDHDDPEFDHIRLRVLENLAIRARE